MSRTRNQRRRDMIFDRIVCIVFLVLLILCLAGLCKQCQDIEALKEQINSTNITIVAADTYLPEGFSAQSAAYQAASQRYDIEQGHILPDKNEAAPESANSEADRCKGAS